MRWLLHSAVCIVQQDVCYYRHLAADAFTLLPPVCHAKEKYLDGIPTELNQSRENISIIKDHTMPPQGGLANQERAGNVNCRKAFGADVKP